MKFVKLVSVTMLGMLILSGCSDSKENETTDSLRKENTQLKEKLSEYETTNEPTVESNKPENVPKVSEKTKLNEEVFLSMSGEEVASLKITEVSTNQSSFPNHMVSLDEYNTDQMIAVTIEYKNIAMTEAFLPHASYFQAFDNEGKALTRVSQQNGQDSVTEGRTGVTKIFFELPVNGSEFSEVEIEFVPGTEKVAVFDLKVSH